MSLSLNKYMHPRNRYKKEKPSFLNLALKYPDFRAKVTQDESGKVLLDFKDAEALRALTTCLLKEDFDLTVEMPVIHITWSECDSKSIQTHQLYRSISNMQIVILTLET